VNPPRLHPSRLDRAIPLDRLLVALACLVYVAGYVGLTFHLPLRYLIYLTPLILLMAACVDPRLPVARYVVLFIATYAMVAVCVRITGGNSHNFTRDFVLISLTLICYVPLVATSANLVRLIFFGTVATFVFNYLVVAEGGFSISILRSVSLDGGYNGNEGLIGPLYLAFFTAVGARFEAVIAGIMTLLGGKRIGLFSAIVALVVFYVIAYHPAFRSRHRIAVIVALALTGFSVLAINLPVIAPVLLKAIGSTVHVEEFMSGRFHIGNGLLNLVNEQTLVQTVFGSGAGTADQATAILTDGRDELAHNDWLKIRIDYGLVGLVGFVVFLSALFAHSALGAAFAMIVGIQMMSDNVLIYVFYHFPIAIMLAYETTLVHQRRRDETAPHSARKTIFDVGSVGPSR